MVLLLFLVLLWASGVSAATLNVTTPAELDTAIGTAVAGDEIVLANGTYTGQHFIGTNSGTAAQPITIRAANRHQAIMNGDGICDRGHEGFIVYRPYWIIKDIKFQNHGRSISVYRDNTIIKDNLIDSFLEEGIRVDGVDFPPVQNVLIENNVIANGATCTGTDSPGIYLVRDVNFTTVRNNIVLGTGNNSYQCAGVGGCGGGAEDKFGYGMLVANNSDDNLIQGNLFLANQGKGIMRILSDEFNSLSSNRNVVRDNAALFGEGAGFVSDDCSDDANSFLNNIAYGNYFWNWYTKGNKTSLLGHMLTQHNLFYADDFTRGNAGYILSTCNSQSVAYKVVNTLKDNLFYSNGAQTGAVDTRILLTLQGPQASVLSVNDHNLFWAPSATGTWVNAYTYAGTDVHATGSPPVFVNAADGDFSLATGSPGKGAASDGTDIGISYNSFLKKAWLQNAFRLPTQLADPVTTSASFPVDPAHYYQIWFYLPNAPFNGVETFVVEGVNRIRDIATLHSNTTWTQPSGPARWITLGRAKAADGTLNITWTNATSANKIFIRQLPTAAEAYQWLLASPSQAGGTSEQIPFHPSDINWNHPLTRDLTNWWRGVPTLVGGRTFYNLVRGSTNHGTLTNMGNTTTSGWSGTSRPGGYAKIGCDGTNDYVLTQVNAGVTYNNPFSVCFWLYPTATTGSSVVMGTAQESAPYDGVWLQWSNVGAAQLLFILSSTAGGQERLITSAPFATNTWYHVCATYDGSQVAATGMKLYVNGGTRATTVDNDSGFGTFPDRPWNFCADTLGTPVDYSSGFLDDIRTFKRALSATDIEWLYHQSLQGDLELLQSYPDTVIFSLVLDQIIIPRRILLE